jgi:hypothetical protein
MLTSTIEDTVSVEESAQNDAFFGELFRVTVYKYGNATLSLSFADERTENRKTTAPNRQKHDKSKDFLEYLFKSANYVNTIKSKYK